jgi:hypothetical protein
VKLTNREEYMFKRPKASSEGLSLRIDSDILNAIRKEALQKDISVNTLLNQITKQYVQWYSHAAAAGFVTIRKQSLIKLINRLEEAEISNIAKEISKESKDFVLFLRSEYNLESVLDVIQTWIRICAYKYRSEINSNTQLHIIQHDMGKKWSFYLAEVFRYIFEALEVRKVDFDTTENTLSFLLHIGRT